MTMSAPGGDPTENQIGDQSELKRLIECGRTRDACNIISNIGARQDVAAVPVLINYLQSTESPTLRNAIALALSDIGDPSAVEPLISTLLDRRTKHYTGTLLYALESFDVSAHVDVIVDFLLDPNYEASRTALGVLENSVTAISAEKRQALIKKIEKKIDDLNDDVSMLSHAVEVIENL